jgi:hypothetical protein
MLRELGFAFWVSWIVCGKFSRSTALGEALTNHLQNSQHIAREDFVFSKADLRGHNA